MKTLVVLLTLVVFGLVLTSPISCKYLFERAAAPAPVAALPTSHIEKPAQKVDIPVRRAPVYRKVLPGGKLDGKLKCKDVPLVAHRYPKAVVLQYAKSYGLPPAKIEQLRVCL